MLKSAMDANIDYRQSREYKNKYYANGGKRPFPAYARYSRACPNDKCAVARYGLAIDGLVSAAGRFPYRGRDIKRSTLAADGTRTYYVSCPCCGTEVVHSVLKKT